jgi:hypothetical protein
MKTHSLFLMILILSIITLSCGTSATKAPNMDVPNMFDNPPASGLTPANLDVVIGTSEPVIAIGNNWPSYQNDEIGISFNYPPSWQAIMLSNVPGVGLYPPESNPNFPTPMIRIEWLNVPYLSDQPLVKTESPINPIEISGVTGRQYQDSKFALPTQSSYIEMPHHDGTLFFITTIGPSVDLVPQLNEILKTLNLSSSANIPPATEAPMEPPANQASPISFIYPVDGQILDYEGSYLFKVTPMDGADGYLWGFFQNDVMVWENFRDEGVLSGTEYSIPEGSFAHNKFIPGSVQVWVRASINSQWTDPTIITIYLRPR